MGNKAEARALREMPFQGEQSTDTVFQMRKPVRESLQGKTYPT